MKLGKKIISSLLALVMVAASSPVYVFGASSATQNSSEAVAISDINYGQQDNIQDGVILHCWNWSYNNIKKYLPQIAAAGYTAVQTSPVTQPKDYYSDGFAYGNVGIPDGVGGYDANWWKAYQPVSENICDNGHIWYGTKAEFKAMCDEAEKYGIKVIVDIVANNMAGINGWKIGSVDEVMGDISPQVGEFCNPDMLTDSSYWHISTSWAHSSDKRFDVTQGNMGMPDLNTGDEKVQNMILSLLKECIDNGADGFRFDAAKYIETPVDNSDFASDFWDVVLDGATSYAQSTKGFTPYYYGEFLSKINDTEVENYYLSKMSVTDNQTGENIRNDFKYDLVEHASNSGYCEYAHGQGDKVVLWAESHDTYMGGGSSYECNDSTIKKAWAAVASRKDSTALYFARPFYSYEILTDDKNGYDARRDPKELAEEIRQTQLGEVGTLTWMDTCVAEVNRFKNHFTGQSEYLGNSGNKLFYNVRGDSGVVLVSTNGAGEVSVNLGRKMKDGTYTDQVTGNTFTVSGGTITGTIGNADGIAVVYNTTSVPRSTIKAPRENFAYDSIGITVGLDNATSGTFSINGGAAVTYTEDTTISIGLGDKIGTNYDIVLTATDGKNTTSATYTFTKESKYTYPVSIICSQKDGSTFSTDTITLTIEVKNADTATYKVGDQDEVAFTGETKITIGEGLKDGDTVTLRVSGTNSLGNVTKEYTFTKKTGETGTGEAGTGEAETGVVYFKNTGNWSSVSAYAWIDKDGIFKNNAAWPGQLMECIDRENQIYSIELTEKYEYIIFNNSGNNSQTGELTPQVGCVFDYNIREWLEYTDTTKCIVAGYMYDESGNQVAGNMTGLGEYEGNENVTLTAPIVEGYNFAGWYTYDSSTSNSKHYTGDMLCESRTYSFNVKADASLVAVYKPNGNASVTIDGSGSFTVNEQLKSQPYTESLPIGSKVTIVCNKDNFEYWKNSAGMVLSRDKSYTFTVTGKESISAVFNTIEDNKATVVFESYYGQVIARDQYASGATITEPGLPFRYGYTALGWDYNGDGKYDASEGTEDTFAKALERGFAAENKLVKILPVYKLIENTYQITVENGTGEGTYKQNEVVTVEANEPSENQKFSHWTDGDGNILSYNEKYRFYAAKDITVKAVYVADTTEVEARGTTEIIDRFADKANGKLTFVSMSTVPEGCTINKAGIIATNDKSVAESGDEFNASTAKIVRGNAWTGDAYRYTWSISMDAGQTCYVRAYLVYTDAEGNVNTVYGNMVSQTMGN